VAQFTGWDWHPLPNSWRSEPIAPLFWVVTYPIHVLPISMQPLALNIFTAICAALTLGLLTASVRMLPQDRTRDQRQREGGEYGQISGRLAFLPQLFAVLMLGFQLTFWQHAVSASGEMLDLLVFALIVFCVLRFRISQNDNWLFLMALIYGMGVSNNWALIGYFPLFIFSLIWIRGLSFFNIRFIFLMIFCGAIGLSLYLMEPAMASHRQHQNFWYLLQQEWRGQSFALQVVPRYVVLVAALATILPLLFAGVRWPSFLGEVSPVGNVLTQLMIKCLHIVFLILPLVTLTEFPFSPSARMKDMPASFLTFFYVGALAIGYFTGYFLLIFGKKGPASWGRESKAETILGKAALGLLWVVVVAGPIVVLWQNVPNVRASSSSALPQFFDSILDGLPTKDAIVLSDDPARLDLLQGAYERRHLANNNILIETGSLGHREYLRYLADRYPKLKAEMDSPEKLPVVIQDKALERFMGYIGTKFPIYYLHTSFGYYFEEYYLVPRGMVYELKGYPDNRPQPPAPTDEEVKTQQAFWTQLESGPLKDLPKLSKLDLDPQVVDTDYSVDLDFWGVELQRANHLPEAHGAFAEAVRLNPDNNIAKINLRYNEALQKGNHQPIDSLELFEKSYLKYGGLIGVLKFNGPVDEPDASLQFGELMAETGNLRQAATLFERRLELLPNDPDALLDMAKTYADRGKVEKVLDLVGKLRSSSKIKEWELTRVQAMAYMRVGSNNVAETMLKQAIKEDPTDSVRVGTLADIDTRFGRRAVRQNKLKVAKGYFAEALTNYDQQIKLMTAERHNAIRDTSFVPVLLKKAEMEVVIEALNPAVETLSEIIRMQPENTTALLNRASVEAKLKNIDGAKADLKAMSKLMPKQQYLVEYHMADIAALEHDPAEEIRHLKNYLRMTPEETTEFANVAKRIEKLEGH
jgi:tetratricopeptide (TPR) repeat protein